MAARDLVEEARRLGFEPLRRCRHGEIWQHQESGRRTCIARSANFSGGSRTAKNQLSNLRRIASL